MENFTVLFNLSKKEMLLLILAFSIHSGSDQTDRNCYYWNFLIFTKIVLNNKDGLAKFTSLKFILIIK
jgi:hypothetical protein